MSLRSWLSIVGVTGSALMSAAILLSAARDADRARALERVRPQGLLVPRESGRFRALAAMPGSPALAPDGTMLAASLDGYLYAVAGSGELRWKRYLGAPSFGGVRRAESGDIFVGTDAGQLFVFDGLGARKGSVRLGAAIETTPLPLPNGDVIVCAGRELVAITRHSKVRFRFRAWGKFFSNPVLGPEGDVFVGSEDGNFYAIHPDGRERYRVYVGAPIHAQAVVGPDGFAYFADERGRVHAVDAWSDEAWVTDLGTPIRGALALSESGQLLALTQGPRVRLVALRAGDGSVAYEYLLALTDGADETSRAGVFVDTLEHVWVTSPGDRLWMFPRIAAEPFSTPFALGATSTPQMSVGGHVVVTDRSGQLLWSAFEVKRILLP